MFCARLSRQADDLAPARGPVSWAGCSSSPVNLEHPDQLAQIVADLTTLRQAAGTAGTQPYDVITDRRHLQAT
jgi:hypothetical protein